MDFDSFGMAPWDTGGRNSRELTWTLARAAPGVTPVDSSGKGAPVRELIWPSVLESPSLIVYKNR